MKIIIAPDKFKGSLTALQVAQAMAEGVRLIDPTIEVHQLPLADGGEGSADVLTQAVGGQTITIAVKDPLFRTIEASYGLSADGQMAFVEMATASGLALLEKHERNPLLTTTFGTGELILDALQRGAKRLIVCIGGSATNDAGMGIAAALGFRFLDKNGAALSPIGQNLAAICRIDIDSVTPLLQNVEVVVACDVSNPLHGPNGAAYVYAPQKGADAAAVQQLDNGLVNFSQVVQNQFGIDLQTVEGSGAAGGLGSGCVAFLNAKLQSGIETVLQAVEFEKHLIGADLVLTGEGKIDQQTLQGKLIAGVARAANAQHVPVVALCGTLSLSPQEIDTLGLSYAVSVLASPVTLQEAMNDAHQNVRDSTAAVVRFVKKMYSR